MSGLGLSNAFPLWGLAAIVVGVSIVFSVGLQLLTCWRFGVDLLAGNHEVAGFKYAVLGVAYAVLLAFVVVSVWNEYERTERSVEAEAERFYNLYWTSYNFPDSSGKAMREALVDYATQVHDQDWPEMKRGCRGSATAAETYTRLSSIVGQTKADDIGLLPSAAHAINLLPQTADRRPQTADRGLSAGAAVGCGRSCDTGNLGGLVDEWSHHACLSGIFRNEVCRCLSSDDRRACSHHRRNVFSDDRLDLSEGVTAQPIDDVIRRIQKENAASSK